MLPFPASFVLFDTEYTAWPDSLETDWGGENQFREIIQIGAIGVDRDAMKETDAFSVLVRPVRNPKLSEFIIGLTGISQEQVDAGKSFPDALSSFQAFVGGRAAYCWGRDVDVFDENGEFTGDARRLSRGQYADLKPLVVPLLEERGIDETRYSSGTLYKAFGLPSVRAAHDALNDMRNLLDALRVMSS